MYTNTVPFILMLLTKGIPGKEQIWEVGGIHVYFGTANFEMRGVQVGLFNSPEGLKPGAGRDWEVSAYRWY